MESFLCGNILHHPLNIETLLFGRCENNCSIFLAVQNNIKDSSRFHRQYCILGFFSMCRAGLS